jgi:hypothetical protein
MTLYYFGQGDPADEGVAGRRVTIDAGTVHPGLPDRLGADTEYLAASASLVWGPWGPPAYFDALRAVEPTAWTEDRTIVVYRTDDVSRASGDINPSSRRPGPP